MSYSVLIPKKALRISLFKTVGLRVFLHWMPILRLCYSILIIPYLWMKVPFWMSNMYLGGCFLVTIMLKVFRKSENPKQFFRFCSKSWFKVFHTDKQNTIKKIINTRSSILMMPNKNVCVEMPLKMSKQWISKETEMDIPQ